MFGPVLRRLSLLMNFTRFHCVVLWRIKWSAQLFQWGILATLTARPAAPLKSFNLEMVWVLDAFIAVCEESTPSRY